VKVDMPLQAYFRINAENMGQFERTLIIADEGSEVHYIEGCTAPTYTSDSLHSAVVEIVVKKAPASRYTTIQNWSNNVFNLVTKRARVEAEGHMEWIDGNIGSSLTMKYPAVCAGGPEGLGRGAVGRLRRPRPAPGRRGQDGPRGARRHTSKHREQEHQQGRRPLLATAGW
jgi:Fe-S cluster assembly protein SufB